jgi:hypothetical protein
MIPDDTYRLMAAARRLLVSGEWDTALDLIAHLRGEDVAELRAHILVDRHWWRLEGSDAAQGAVDALEPASLPAMYRRAQLAYARILFDTDPHPDDARSVGAGFEAAAADEALAGWGTFWLGVVADNVDNDPDRARLRYAEAMRLCRQDRDLLLESYVARHLSGHAVDRDPAQAEALLRRSLHLRSTLGARPAVAAAQLALAEELPAGPERETLRESAAVTADELGLTWLKDSLSVR